MTFNDFFNISTFIGDRKFCYAILRQPIGKDNFDTLVKILPTQKRFLVNADAKGQNKDKDFYFVTAIDEKTHRANCVLVYEEDCPFSPKTKGVFKVTKKYVLSKMKKKKKEEGASIKLEKKVEKIIQEETETFFLQKDNKTQGQKKYEDFLQTDYWKMVREIKLQQSENKCQVCGSKTNLNVHHNTYAHHGKEHLHLADLVVLCKDCHSLFHHKLSQEPKFEDYRFIEPSDFCPF